jgi:hypothetical protein
LVPCAPLDWANAGAAHSPMVVTTMSVVRISASLAIAGGYHKPHSHNPTGVIRYGFIQRATLRRASTGGQRLSGAQ